MKKADIVLVVLNEKFLERAIQSLNFDNVNLVMIITDNANDDKVFKVGNNEIPMDLFSRVNLHARTYRDLIWLISGYVNDISDLEAIKNFLMANGVPEENIFNFEISSQFSPTWFANLHYIEEHGADFFATGNEYAQVNLNFNYIPCVYRKKSRALGGVNLSDVNQDLWQSFLTAQYVFKKVGRKKIKFVLIGLSPHSFHYDNLKDFSACSKTLQYMSLFTMNFIHAEIQQDFFSVDSLEEDDFPTVEKEPQHLSFFNYPYPNAYSRLMEDIIDDKIKNVFSSKTSAQADLNFDTLKEEFNHEFFAKSVIDWKGKIKSLNDAVVEKNFIILEDYIKLCLSKGAKPIGVVFPFAPLARKKYDKKVLALFREKIHSLEQTYDFVCVDWFDHLSYNAFSDMTHLNLKGTLYVNSAISLKLYKENLLPASGFRDMTYDFFNLLLRTAREENPDELMGKVFELTVKKISQKDKIKVCFVMYEVAMWCGDDLYNFFAQDERFEPTIYLCLRRDQAENEFIVKDFMNGVEQLKSRGLNVVALEEDDVDIPKQDIIIYLVPYLYRLPKAFIIEEVTLKTLAVHIPYALDVVLHDIPFYSQKLFLVAWKVFFTSELQRKIYAEKSITGIPRGVYGGYPRMDHFFKRRSEFHFDWKMARPDAKKIIWAPHHSIPDDSLIKGATFQWNYQFLYEFAKAHPETSWVVKPHPNLVYQTIVAKIFSSVEDYEEYLRKWDDLPNAQVYTGAYYQDVFATSDGMIHDSCSFTAEYQYVNKPMIYLTRETQKFNELGEEILKVSYLVDGRDLDAIAEMIQTVFIEGKDDKAAARKEIFDKYLNYWKYNGMSASEFIYKSIADEFKEPSA